MIKRKQAVLFVIGFLACSWLASVSAQTTADLTFVPDPGFRVEKASNPAPSVDPETGTVYLFYADRSFDPPRAKVAASSDGLNFSAGRQPTEQDNPHHPFHVHLPDGIWRKYLPDLTHGLKSASSADGIHYTLDQGFRYTPSPRDNGTMGVCNVYVDPSGGGVLLYVGDMGGLNNVRRAYSPPGDNGWTFTFEDDNVLKDADAGGHGYSYVDPKSILLPDGRRRLFTMRQGPAPPQPGVRAAGTIYSFISDDGKTYTLEPGVRLAPDDFLEFEVWSLNDPVVVRLPDGRYRMYVAALLTDGSGGTKWVIVSATAAGQRPPWPTPIPSTDVSFGVGDPLPDVFIRPLLGVIAGPDPNAGFTAPNLTTQYQDIGVISVRNNDYYDDRLDMEGIFNCGGPTYPSWEGCDPNDDANYNWGPSDAQFASYLAGGFDPFLRLGGEWENSNRPHDFKGPQDAIQENNWIIAAHKVVDRYLHWSGVEQTFTYLDIWTEFPGNHFWDRSNIEFIDFWVKAYASLKGAYPQLKVGGPGFNAGETMKVIQGNADLSRVLLTELYDQDLHPDWFGWHFFSNDPINWAQAALAYRQLFDGDGPYADVPWAGTGFFNDMAMIVDAFGFSSRGSSGAPPPQGARRASLLTAAWIAMQYGGVKRAYYYRGNDFGASSPGDGSGGPGLFYGDAAGTYKPSANAFRLWSQVYGKYPHLLQVPRPSTDPQLPLWVLAAQNDLWDIALLVSNPTTAEVTWSPLFADGTSLEDYARVELYQIDEANDGRTPTSVSDASITIPPYTVQLLVLHRVRSVGSLRPIGSFGVE